METDKQTPVKAGRLRRFKIDASLTGTGLAFIQADPDISSETLKALIRSDGHLISLVDMEEISSLSKTRLADRVFYENNQTGFVHLACCIEDDLNQSKAELISLYSSEKNIPFVQGAIYLDALLARDKILYYIKKGGKHGYTDIQWMPKKQCDCTENQNRNTPPKKRDAFVAKVKETKESKENKKAIKIPPCPHCGEKITLSFVRRKKADCSGSPLLFQVLCSDQTGDCPLSKGLEPAESLIDALDRYREYCDTVERMTSDV